jgi:hypothetical protein
MGLRETAGAGAAHNEAANAILPKEEILLLIRSINDYRFLRMKLQVWVRSARAEASTGTAAARALDGDPAAIKAATSALESGGEIGLDYAIPGWISLCVLRDSRGACPRAARSADPGALPQNEEISQCHRLRSSC